VYVSGVDWGVPGFGDTLITKNLQQLLAAGMAPPLTGSAMLTPESDFRRPEL
jgi:hypothetical protein